MLNQRGGGAVGAGKNAILWRSRRGMRPRAQKKGRRLVISYEHLTEGTPRKRKKEEEASGESQKRSGSQHPR